MFEISEKMLKTVKQGNGSLIRGAKTSRPRDLQIAIGRVGKWEGAENGF